MLKDFLPTFTVLKFEISSEKCCDKTWTTLNKGNYIILRNTWKELCRMDEWDERVRSDDIDQQRK